MYYVQGDGTHRSISYQTIAECRHFAERIMPIPGYHHPYVIRESDGQPILKLATAYQQMRNDHIRRQRTHALNA